MVTDNVREDIIVMPNGDKFSRANIVESSINYYKEKYEENITDICDFSEGSEIRTLHESWAVELFAKYKDSERKAKQKYVKYATGTYLDELACEFHLTRKRGEVARGTVVFSTSAGVSAGATIPRGTVILSRKSGYEYILQNDVVISSPNTPVNGEVYSKLPGAEYNALEDTLTAFKDLSVVRPDIKVTNPTPIIGGVNVENDDSLRDRILQVKQEGSYGTVSAYRNLIVQEVNDVHDIQFVEPDVLKTDEKYPRHYKAGTTEEKTKDKTFEELKQYMCTDCTAVLFINATSKPCPDETIDEVEYVMTQQNHLVVGQKFHIEKAGLKKLYFAMELFVTTVVDEDIIREHLESFFDGGSVETKSGTKTYNGMNIGENLVKSDLIDALEDIPGIHQVGYVKLAKYYPDIPTAINQWNNNGDSGYTYVDDENYSYWRRNSDSSSVGHWGVKHFTVLSTTEGNVFSLGQKKDLDSSTKQIFTMTQKKINEQGEVI